MSIRERKDPKEKIVWHIEDISSQLRQQLKHQREKQGHHYN